MHGGVTVAFSILEEVARAKGTLANGGGELINYITIAAVVLYSVSNRWEC